MAGSCSQALYTEKKYTTCTLTTYMECYTKFSYDWHNIIAYVY